MNYQKLNKIGIILLTAGISIALCSVFFITFGTKQIINSDYLAPSSVTQQVDDSQTTTEQTKTTAESTTAANSANASTTASSQKPTVKMQETQTKKKTAANDAKITIPGLTEIALKANSKTADVDLYNPGKNDCYFKITIKLKDGAVLYQSDYVRPGQHIYEIQLKKSLKKGEYDAVLHYDTYSTDGNYDEYNGADVPFTITAK